jgi:hypothetical protein
LLAPPLALTPQAFRGPDNIKLCGSHRKSYFMMTAWMASAGYLCLWLLPATYGSAAGFLFAVRRRLYAINLYNSHHI